MNCNKMALTILSIVLFHLVPDEVKAQELKVSENLLNDISPLYLAKLIASAKENYPRFKQLNSQINTAKNDVNAAKISWLEPLSFAYAARSNNTQANLVDVTTQDLLTGYQFGVSISPGALLSKPGQVKKAKEQVKIAEYNREEYELTIESEVKRRYYIYLLSQKSLVPVNNALVDAENNFKLAKLSFQKAEITLQSYIEASGGFNSAYTAKLQAEVNLLSAKASLEELTVKKLEEIK